VSERRIFEVLLVSLRVSMLGFKFLGGLITLELRAGHVSRGSNHGISLSNVYS
jgi:hypothetical protein